MRKNFFNNLRVRKIFPIVTTPSPKHEKINLTTSKGNILKKNQVLNGKYYQQTQKIYDIGGGKACSHISQRDRSLFL